MSIGSAVDSNISNRTINTNRISNRTYDSKSNRITKLRRSLVYTHSLTLTYRHYAVVTTHQNEKNDVCMTRGVDVSLSRQSSKQIAPPQVQSVLEVSFCRWAIKFLRRISSRCRDVPTKTRPSTFGAQYYTAYQSDMNKVGGVIVYSRRRSGGKNTTWPRVVDSTPRAVLELPG